jgi:YD repeat-containing protein
VPRRLLAVIAVLFFCFTAQSSKAQATSVADDTAPPIPGAGHDYIHLLSETVNPANGSVNLNIAVPTPKSRGLSLPFAITYSSGGAGHPIPNGYASSMFGKGGWGTTLPLLSSTNSTVVFPNNVPEEGDSGETCYFSTGYVFYDPSGASHNLNLAAMSPPPFQPNGYCNNMGSGFASFSPSNNGGDSQVESTYPTPCAQVNQNGPFNSTCQQGNPPVEVFDRNGSIYTFQPTSSLTIYPNTIEDRNGNILTFNGGNISPTSITDTAGRPQVSFTYTTVPESVTYVVGGLSYVLTYEQVTENIPSDFEQIAGPISPFPSNYTCEQTPGNTKPYVVKTLTLPNEQTYQFSYDPTYGLLTEVIYPDGGWVKYTWKMSDTYSENDMYAAWSTIAGNNPLNDECNFLYKSPVVATRTVGFTSSTTPVLTQTFTYNTAWNSGSSNWTWSSKSTTVTTTDNVRGLVSKAVYQYSPVYIQPPPGFSTQGVVASEVAVESQVQSYDWGSGTPGGLLETVNKLWADQFNMTQEQTVYNVSGNNTSEVDYAYGFGGLETQKTEYDFGPGSRGALLRTTVNTPQTFAANPLFVTSSNIPTLQAFPCQTIIYQGSASPGNRIAETDYLYDNASATCATPGAPTVSAVSNLPTGTHDEACFGVTRGTGCPGTGVVPRGNITSIIKQCLQSCSNATTTYTYDETGQVLTSKDPCGNGSCGDILNSTNHTTSFSYQDSDTPCSGAAPPSGNTNAYLTQVTDALGHITSYCYGYTDGQVRGITDVNSLTTYYKYADPLGRLTETDLPNGGETTIAYNDGVPSVTTSKKITSTQSLITETIMDGVGHPITTELTDPQGMDYTATTYDGEGKPYTVSNPYRSTSDATYGLTTYTYDGLERTTKVLEPDGSSILHAYCAGSVKTTDEAGKWRRATTDGLGRISEADEPNSSTATIGACPAVGDPTWITTYQYDALNDFTTVVQGGSRNRSFAYDSLARLTTATNPESGTISYVYDLNGNVVTKSNANGKSGSYDYDVLNRELYENPSPWDDSPKAFTYDTSTNCSGVPRCANVGRLVEPANYIGYYIYSYDPVDRQTSVSVGMSGVYKTTVYQFNYDDSLASITYPSGRVVNYTVDSAGRPSVAQDSSTKVFYAQGTCANGVGSNGVCYSASGAIAQIENGTNVVTTTIYNQRFQPCWIFATTGVALPWQANSISCSSTASPAGNLLDLKYNFGSPADNGDVIDITNNRDTTRNQSFTYDQVNRLLSGVTSASSGSKCWGQSYTYDQWANLHGIAVTQCSSRMLSATVNSYNQISGSTYDASGNVTSDGTYTYGWYADGRLASVAGTTTYFYDAAGNRIEKATNGTPSKMYWYGSGTEALDETDGTGNVSDEYIFFGARRVAHVLAATGVVDFYVQDDLGTSRTLVQNGQTSLCYDADFLPYGAENVLTST